MVFDCIEQYHNLETTFVFNFVVIIIYDRVHFLLFYALFYNFGLIFIPINKLVSTYIGFFR